MLFSVCFCKTKCFICLTIEENSNNQDKKKTLEETNQLVQMESTSESNITNSLINVACQKKKTV